MQKNRIPVIDLSTFAANAEQSRSVAAQLADACEQLGFLVISGHGVDAAVAQRLYQTGKAFFDLPLPQKLSVRRPRNDQNRGYIPYGEETLARMHGGDTPPDFKEVFAVGPDDIPAQDPYYSGPQSYPSFAPNLWPDQPPTLQADMLAYFQQMENLMRTLGRVFAVALGLDENFFADKLDKHTSQLRLLHYPPPQSDLAPGQLRCGAHSDLGMMTILRNEAVPGGLQVQARNGTWLDVPALNNTFVVNIGDLMMRWTNDHWRSTLHRVSVPPADLRAQSRRLSIGFFVGPNYDTLVECLATCQTANNPPRYEPVTAHDYRTQRFAAGAGLQSRV